MHRVYRRRRSATVLATCRATPHAPIDTIVISERWKKKNFGGKKGYIHTRLSAFYFCVLSTAWGTAEAAASSRVREKKRKKGKQKENDCALFYNAIIYICICEYAIDRQAEFTRLVTCAANDLQILQSITTIEKRRARDPRRAIRRRVPSIWSAWLSSKLRTCGEHFRAKIVTWILQLKLNNGEVKISSTSN